MQPDPRVALVVITDGRGEYLHQTMESLRVNLRHRFVSRTIIDDSADAEYGKWLESEYPTFAIWHHGARSGLGSSVRSGWTNALESDAEYIWHQEDDFTFNKGVDLVRMADCLAASPHLAQISLKRQAVNATEREAGGFMQVEPDRYRDAGGWVEHDVCFSLNPCLIPRSVVEGCLTSVDDLIEAPITKHLVGAGYWFGVWGSTADAPRVTHIGAQRSAGWRV